MIDKLIDFLIDVLDLFRFWVVVDAYERHVILRFGVHNRTLAPGIHWFAPFGIERSLRDNVVARVINLGAQSLTTKDGENVAVSGVVTAEIRDIEKAMLAVEDVDHALADSCVGTIGQLVAAATWAELQGEGFSETLTKACRKQAWRYGIEITRVQLSDLSKAHVLRIHTGN